MNMMAISACHLAWPLSSSSAGKYQYVMVLFRFDQKRSFDGEKKILFALALCMLQQQLVRLCWKFCSPNRFASNQWLHSKSLRNIYDQMTPLPEPDWHMGKPFSPGDAVFTEWDVDAFNAHLFWVVGTGFQEIWALVTAFPKQQSTVPASPFQIKVEIRVEVQIEVSSFSWNGVERIASQWRQLLCCKPELSALFNNLGDSALCFQKKWKD